MTSTATHRVTTTTIPAARGHLGRLLIPLHRLLAMIAVALGAVLALPVAAQAATDPQRPGWGSAAVITTSGSQVAPACTGSSCQGIVTSAAPAGSVATSSLVAVTLAVAVAAVVVLLALAARRLSRSRGVAPTALGV